MNDEPWGRGGSPLRPSLRPTEFESDSGVDPNHDQTPVLLSIRIRILIIPSLLLLVSLKEQGDLDRVSRQVFWKFSKMDIRIGRYFLILPRKVVTGKCFDSFCKEFRKIEKQFVKSRKFQWEICLRIRNSFGKK